MPDSKITALTALTAADPANDMFPVVDVSDTTMAASGTTKRISINNILACSPSATLASATITGDLTVDTSTLKVDSTNNRVGIGTASPSNSLDVIGSGAQTVRVGSSNGDLAILSMFSNGNATWSLASDSVYRVRRDATEHHRIDATGVATWSNVGGTSGTAMTLNSTGLGVGVSPFYKFQSVGIAAATSSAFNGSGGNLIGALLNSDDANSGANPGVDLRRWTGTAFNHGTSYIATNSAGDTLFYNGAVASNTRATSLKMTIDASGNVGIGVTPSAWGSAFKAVDFGTVGGMTATGVATRFTHNSYNNGTNFIYKASSVAACLYELNAGEHRWFTAPSGTAGNAITFTQAMTLDASGNLLVGKSSAVATAVGIQFQPAGNSYHTLAASTNADTTLLVYSTGAAAYRFYVGMAGTVFATNTTISAISDARLKENVQDLDVGLDAILALKPRKFDWKEGKGKNIKGDRGFIAQEFETVFPNLIDEWKDEAPEGEAPYKSVRQDLIPVLVKAIQELAAEVNALKKA